MPKTIKKQIPNKAWVDMTEEEQKEFKPFINHFTWKDEGTYGPLFVEFRLKEQGALGKMENAFRNYRNGESYGEGKFFAKWFSLRQAEKIARMFGSDVEVC